MESLEQLHGRDALLEELVGALERHRLVTLTGPGGTGKTRLAEAAVARVRDRREAFFVDCSTLTDGSRLAAALSAELQLTDERGPEAAVEAWLDGGPRLLALDNLEQARGIGSSVERLLGAAPELRVLATSRAPLGVRGEHELPVPPLGLPRDATPEAVEASPCGAMFLERARGIGRLRGPLSGEQAADIATLCRRLDGLPLAIELASARTRVLSPAALLRRLDEHDMSVLSRTDGSDRHRSLEAILAWSLDLLNESERRVLEAAAVCAGTFGLDLVATTSGARDVLPEVEALVSSGLILVDEELEAEPRFRLLETIRLGVLGQLGNREHALRKAHAAGVAAILDTWEPRIDSPSPRQALAHLDADRLNLEAAIEWASHHDVPLAASLLAQSGLYWITRGSVAVPISIARDLRRRLPPRTHDWLRVTAFVARVDGWAGDNVEARQMVEEALAFARASQAESEELELLQVVLMIGEETGQRSEMEGIAERILAIEPKNRREMVIHCDARLVLGIGREGFLGGIKVIEEELAEFVAAGAFLRATLSRANLAFSHLAAGQSDRAIPLAAQAAAESRDSGDPPIEAFSLQVLGLASAELGEAEQARTALERALALGIGIGRPLPVMDMLRACGALAAMWGRYREAAWLLGAAERAFAPDPVGIDDRSTGVARHWAAARRGLDPVAWELEQRAGREATIEAAVERARAVILSNPDKKEAHSPVLRHARLTTREIEILTYLGEGRSDAEIGERLFISPKTASVHVANVKAKLGAASRVEVALRARELGLVTAPAVSSPS